MAEHNEHPMDEKALHRLVREYIISSEDKDIQNIMDMTADIVFSPAYAAEASFPQAKDMTDRLYHGLGWKPRRHGLLWLLGIIALMLSLVRIFFILENATRSACRAAF